MHRRLWRLVWTAGLLLAWMLVPGFSGGGALLAKEAAETSAECLLPPSLSSPEPSPMAPCNFCDQNDFCPQRGVRCSFVACTTGPDRCCEYDCVCDITCTTVSSPPANTCALQIPSGCRDPNCTIGGTHTLCVKTFCSETFVRCTWNGTCGASGCCNYDCAPDPTCSGPDPLPDVC
jgi:hypothetical protein